MLDFLCPIGFCRGGHALSSLTDKRNRFELLMQQAQIPSDIVQPYFAEGYIDQVVCSRTNREWTFHLVKNDLVPQDIYRLFCSRVKEKFAHIAEVHFAFSFAAAETATLVEEYWSLFLEWLQKEAPTINGWMGKAKVEAK